jgi:hypothetical protein
MTFMSIINNPNKYNSRQIQKIKITNTTLVINQYYNQRDTQQQTNQE